MKSVLLTTHCGIPGYVQPQLEEKRKIDEEKEPLTLQQLHLKVSMPSSS